MEYQYFNNRRFGKYPGCKYWQDTSTTERMHRYVWQYYHGKIPEGYDVHHIDHNVDNNDISNLELLSKSEHHKRHAAEMSSELKAFYRKNIVKARMAADKWHGSQTGREWHKKHYEQMKERLHVKRDFVCLVCGKSFTSTKIGSKFCCNACKSQYRRNMGFDDVVKKCAFCGNEFKSNKYSNTQCCSKKCAAQLRKIKMEKNQEN